MVEHLTRERIAALLDEPGAAGSDAAHLDVCPECAGEFESMSRMRMALSGMPDLAAPIGAWERIQAELEDRAPRAPAPGGTGVEAGVEAGVDAGVDAAVRARAAADHDRSGLGIFRMPRPVDARWNPLLTAAAIAVLFFAGLGVGRLLGPDGPTITADDTGRAPSELEPASPGGPGADPGTTLLAAEYPEYLRGVAGLRALRDGGPTDAEVATDPALAAERLARLDALIEASREALRDAPADPALNDFLFDVVDERASVAGQLDQTIRQASMEY